jgi:hypothetical protein
MYDKVTSTVISKQMCVFLYYTNVTSKDEGGVRIQNKQLLQLDTN